MAAPDEWARTDVGPAPTVAIKYMGCGDDGNLGIRTTSLPLRTRHDDVLAVRKPARPQPAQQNRVVHSSFAPRSRLHGGGHAEPTATELPAQAESQLPQTACLVACDIDAPTALAGSPEGAAEEAPQGELYLQYCRSKQSLREARPQSASRSRVGGRAESQRWGRIDYSVLRSLP